MKSYEENGNFKDHVLDRGNLEMFREHRDHQLVSTYVMMCGQILHSSCARLYNAYVRIYLRAIICDRRLGRKGCINSYTVLYLSMFVQWLSM